MKLDRLTYEPGSLLDFYEESLAKLGALCERTWHDRLEIVADGQAASLWNPDGALYSGELHFVPADATAARDAAREVFPGCPLTFRLAEAQRPAPLPLDRVIISGAPPPPDLGVAEKLWRNQFQGTGSWRVTKALTPTFHFSLVALVRCEVQAIDQHWSLHRVAAALPGGEPDETLAREISFARAESELEPAPVWPKTDPQTWSALLRHALEPDLAPLLEGIRSRQEHSLRRELDRVDDYFSQYEAELSARAGRKGGKDAKAKIADRLAAAKAEHARRRADQVARHEIHVHPHLDALLLVAEPAWRAALQVQQHHQLSLIEALFVPRNRRWYAQEF